MTNKNTDRILFLAAVLVGLWALPAMSHAQTIRSRELRTGDRIYLRVDGERQWTDTFDVRPGPRVELPMIGSVTLTGVTREGLQPFFVEQISKYVKSPVVHVTALFRVSVLGEVTRPGFYDFPADAMVADALTDAGGLTRDADLAKIRIERAGQIVEAGKPLRTQVDRGATLSQLDMQAGDEIIIPRAADSERTLRMVSLLVGIPIALVGILLLRR